MKNKHIKYKLIKAISLSLLFLWGCIGGFIFILIVNYSHGSPLFGIIGIIILAVGFYPISKIRSKYFKINGTSLDPKQNNNRT